MKLGGRTWFNPFSTEFLEDPYPMYRRLREEEPIHPDPLGYWYVTRYADVVAILKDARFSADYTHWEKYEARFPRHAGATVGSLTASHAKTLLFIDPPDHTRIRKVIARAFTGDALVAFRSGIEEIVDSLLDAIENPEETDVIRDLAYPFPVLTISKILGVPASDCDLIKPWCSALVPALSPFIPIETRERANHATDQFNAYLRGLLRARRAEPRDDLLSALAREENLSEDEAVALAVTLYIAGHETSKHMIGNGVLTLLRHPDQLELLRSDPSLVPRAVEEIFRYESPVQFTCRTALESARVGDQEIQKGEMVGLSFGAANRDPTQFPEPDRFDVTRQHNPHLAFGAGRHFCLGAILARIEGPIAFRKLLERYPRWRLRADAPKWNPLLLFRGLKELPVAFS
jgi:pimeloyl-[acyl-carrier protein] synthase